MNWRHLIQSALLLAGQLPARTPPGRPRQADLKRAISNAYYAMFHALCHSNATALWGNPGGTLIGVGILFRTYAVELETVS